MSNPILPNYEYVPDGEPHVFGDRVYLYGSHDRFNGISFCLNDYVCYSAPINDLTSWRYEGVIFKKKQDPNHRHNFLNALFAPDVCKGPDGKYYLYYFIGYTGVIGVARCDKPAGQFEFIGHVKYKDGTLLGNKSSDTLQFDPGVFVENGKVYLYTGFAPLNYSSFLLRVLKGRKVSTEGAYVTIIDSDMLTIIEPPKPIVPCRKNGKGTEFENHEFFEASSMRKFNGKYYFIYSSYQSHELCYAISSSLTEGFRFGGTLISIGDIGLNGNSVSRPINYCGNTHGSIEKILGKYYVFYHRQTNKHQFSRQACGEEIKMDENGIFNQVEITSQGLNGKPLLGIGYYDTSIVCNLFSKNGACFYGVTRRLNKMHPYLTQVGRDRESNPNQYIANMNNGATCGFKYFVFGEAEKISIGIKGHAKGKVIVKNGINGHQVAEISISGGRKYSRFESPLSIQSGVFPLYFTFIGKGHFDFIDFEIA